MITIPSQHSLRLNSILHSQSSMSLQPALHIYIRTRRHTTTLVTLGGGNIKIEAPSKLEVKAIPKVKVWENINYTSGGRKISVSHL